MNIRVEEPANLRASRDILRTLNSDLYTGEKNLIIKSIAILHGFGYYESINSIYDKDLS